MAEDIVDGVFGTDSRDAPLPDVSFLPGSLSSSLDDQPSFAYGFPQRSLSPDEIPVGLELPFGVPADLTTEEMKELKESGEYLPGSIVGRYDDDGQVHWRLERSAYERS